MSVVEPEDDAAGGLKREDTDPGVRSSLLDPPPPSDGVKASGGEKEALARGEVSGDDRPERRLDPRTEGGVALSNTYVGAVENLRGAAIEQFDAPGKPDPEAITQEMDMPPPDVRDPGPEGGVPTAIIDLDKVGQHPSDPPPKRGLFSRHLKGGKK